MATIEVILKQLIDAIKNNDKAFMQEQIVIQKKADGLGFVKMGFIQYFLKGGNDELGILAVVKNEGISEDPATKKRLKHSVLRTCWKSLIGEDGKFGNLRPWLKELAQKLEIDLMKDSDLKMPKPHIRGPKNYLFTILTPM